jgi:hypothetical protein
MRYLVKKWLFSSGNSSSKGSACQENDSKELKAALDPYQTGTRLRNFILVFAIFACLGYFYWLVPTTTFWLLILAVILIGVLTGYFLAWNLVTIIMKTIIKELHQREQLDHSKK